MGLLSALKKLQQNDTPFKKVNHATAAMCIDDPSQHHEKWYHRLYDTHPPRRGEDRPAREAGLGGIGLTEHCGSRIGVRWDAIIAASVDDENGIPAHYSSQPLQEEQPHAPLHKDRKPPTAVPRVSIFDRTADRVSFFMSTPTNIGIWIVLVVAWTSLFALHIVGSNANFLPAWFTGTAYNFPLNLVTTLQGAAVAGSILFCYDGSTGSKGAL